MSLQSKAQLENTRAKLKVLEDRLIELEREPVTNARTRELTRQSLKKLINQLKEEIVRFEAHEVQLKP
jgi:protein subunit release factor B